MMLRSLALKRLGKSVVSSSSVRVPIRSFATSSDIDDSNDYDIDLISLKRTAKKPANEPTSNPPFAIPIVPKFTTEAPTKIDSHTVFLSINQVKQDPLDYKGYKKSEESGYLEFAESYEIEIKEFINFIRESYDNKIKLLHQLNLVEVLNSLYIYKDLFLKNKIDTINKYNIQSYKNMVSRFVKYLNHDSSFHLTLSNQLLPFISEKETMIELYSKGIGNLVNELKSIHKEFDLEVTNIYDINSKINEIVNQFNFFLEDAKTLGKFDNHFFEIFIQVHRYQNLLSILNSVKNISSEHLLLILNDDQQIISNKLKQRSGEDLMIQSLVDDYINEINLINSYISYANFPELLSKLYYQAQTNDYIAANIFNSVLQKFLPLLCNGGLSNNDIELITPYNNNKIKFSISHNPRENYEINILAESNLQNSIGLLKYLRFQLNKNEPSPTSKKFQDFKNFQILNELNHIIKFFKGSSVVSEKLEELKNSLSTYFTYVSWKFVTLDDFVDNKAWSIVLQDHFDDFLVYSEVNDAYPVVDLVDEVESISLESVTSLAVHHNISFKDIIFELNMFKLSELDGLPYEYVNAATVLDILDARIHEVTNNVSSSTPLSSIKEENLEKYVELLNRLEKWFDLNGANTLLLDEILADSIPVKKYTQIPDDLELEKFIKELTIFRDDELGSPFKFVSSTKINTLLDQRIHEVYNKGAEDRDKGLNRGNVYNFIRLSKRLTRLFEANGGNTEVLDILIHSQLVFNNMEQKILEKKKLKQAAAEKKLEEAKPVQKPYVQIPDDLELHKFINELSIFKKDELKGDYADFSHEHINSLLDKRINEVHNNLESSNPSPGMNKENIFEFMRLSKRLTRLFDLNAGHTPILDTLIQSLSVLDSVEAKIAEKKRLKEQKLKEEKAAQEKKKYVQIPDDLELHKFSKELAIFKTDELKSSYKNFSPDHINKLLDSRINEVHNDLPNTNPASRLSKDNVFEFMRLSKRLTRLFDLNGGHTAILDTLLHSQSVLDSVEAKIAEKKRLNEQKEAEAKAVAAAKPYVQIPDDLELHKFSNELRIFTKDELKGPFKEFSADHINTLLDKRINEIHNDLPNSNPSSAMSKDNIFEFMRLSKRLTRLFDLNGGFTPVLDTLIQSQSVFEDIESKILKKRKRLEDVPVTSIHDAGKKNTSPKPYRQYPDDFFLEEYAMDLIQLKTEMGAANFKDFGTEEVLQTLKQMINNEKKYNLEKRIALSKLYRNLAILFKHNGEKSFILDNVLINAQVYSDFESNKRSRKIDPKPTETKSTAELKEVTGSNVDVKERISIPTNEKYTDKFDMNEFINKEPNAKQSSQEYRDSEYILSLLTKNKGESGELNFDVADLMKSDIRDAVTTALSKKHECTFHEEDSDELNDLENLTSEKLRENYKIKPVNKKSSQAPGTHEHKINKDSLASFLQNAKNEEDLAQERKFRETKAFEWSKSMVNSHRSLEAHNFFDPLLPIHSTKSKTSPKDLLFPKNNKFHGKVQYLILTLDGQRIISDESPLKEKTNEDLFTILNKFSKEDLSKFIKHVKKLQKKNWKLIGGGGKERMLVFERAKPHKKSFFFTKIKTVLASTGALFITLVGLNVWIDDPASGGKDNGAQLMIDTPVVKEPTPVVDVTDSLADQKQSTWKGLFWRTD